MAFRSRTRAVEAELTAEADWSPGFFEQLSAVPPETATAVDELLRFIRQGRANLDSMTGIPGLTVEDWSAP
jgi:hypothetical protein